VTQTSEGRLKTYVLSLAVMVPFRRSGVASSLMARVQERQLANPNVCALWLHVHVHNDAAVKFYRKLGFVIKNRLHNYYTVDTGLVARSRDAYVMEKDLKALRRARKQLEKERQQLLQGVAQYHHSRNPDGGNDDDQQQSTGSSSSSYHDNDDHRNSSSHHENTQLQEQQHQPGQQLLLLQSQRPILLGGYATQQRRRRRRRRRPARADADCVMRYRSS
jgi:hypothetical protein